MKYTELNCAYCGTPYTRLAKEVNRSLKLGRKCYCSKSCMLSGRTEDGFASGRFNIASDLVINAKKRAVATDKEFDLDVVYINELFKVQLGKCALSGVDMFFATRTEDKSLYQVSIDRIDNTKGYIKGNVQLVALGINYMRNDFTVADAITFIEDVKKTCINSAVE